MLKLPPGRTVWHITVGTYGSRLHGADEPTVDREHNQRGTPFLPPDPQRRRDESAAMRARAVLLNEDQRAFIEASLPSICNRGRWDFIICAAPGKGEEDHFHLMLAADPKPHGKQIRHWLKRWLTEALDNRFGRPPGGEWWVDGGSTKPVKDEDYFLNTYFYILRQRTTPFTS
jgi:REP element-mobilizing transposase RayT